MTTDKEVIVSVEDGAYKWEHRYKGVLINTYDTTITRLDDGQLVGKSARSVLLPLNWFLEHGTFLRPDPLIPPVE